MSAITEIRRRVPLLSMQKISPAREEEETVVSAVHEIAVGDILPNRSQPRSCFNQNAIFRLSDSIRHYGVLQPLTVRKVLLPPAVRGGAPTTIYELIAGERRLRAAKQAGLATVPCIIVNTDDATSAELAVIENLLRENLNMFEQAEAFQRLISEFHLTQEETARRVSMSQSAVANKLRILRLAPEEREKILQAGLTERHARALLKIPDSTLRDSVLTHMIVCKMNVSAAEQYIDGILNDMARFRRTVEAVPLGKPIVPADPIEHVSAVREVPETAKALEIPGKIGKAGQDADEELPAPLQDLCASRCTRFKGSIKDLRLFYNSIRNALQILEESGSGIRGEFRKEEREGDVTVTVRLRRAE